MSGSACSSACGWCGACTAPWDDDGYDDARCLDCGAGADESCTDDCLCDDCCPETEDDDADL